MALVEETEMHVDLVKNDWTSGQQIRLARIVRANGGVAVEYFTDARYEHLLTEPLRPRDTDEIVYLGKIDADEAFALLPQIFSGDFLFATEPHEDATCGFGKNDVIPMQRLSEAT
jgi:hypothetical protein